MFVNAKRAFKVVVQNPTRALTLGATFALGACSQPVSQQHVTTYTGPQERLNATSRNLRIAQDMTKQLCQGTISFDPNCGWAQANEKYAAYMQLVQLLGNSDEDRVKKDHLKTHCGPLEAVSLRVIYGEHSDDHVNELASKFAQNPQKWKEQTDACGLVGFTVLNARRILTAAGSPR